METLDIKQMLELVKLLASEKDLPEDAVIGAIEAAIAAAWRKENGSRDQDVRAEINLNTGEAEVFVKRIVVDDEEAYNIYTEIPLKEAKKLDKKAEIDSEVEESYKVTSFGRVSSTTARQVLMSKIKEAEKEAVMTEYADKIHTVVSGVVTRAESRFVLVDLGRTEGFMPRPEWIQGEYYRVGSRIKVYIKGIESTEKGAQLLLSRADAQFVLYLFAQEVPEIENGVVAINSIAREAGKRTKIAVSTTVPGVDPIGAFVGGRGTRIQSVVEELGGDERIDIVEWSEDPVEFIQAAISPAEVVRVVVNEAKKQADVFVAPDQHAIAIGRSGQNVRLASDLTGYRIDLEVTDEKPAAPKEAAKPTRKKSAEDSLFAALEETE